MKSILLIIILVAVGGIGYRFLPKTNAKSPTAAPIVAVPVPVACSVADSTRYWKAKYDSLYGVWTEARERIFTKRKYQVQKI